MGVSCEISKRFNFFACSQNQKCVDLLRKVVREAACLYFSMFVHPTKGFSIVLVWSPVIIVVFAVFQDLGIPLAVNIKLQLNLVMKPARFVRRARKFNELTLPICWLHMVRFPHASMRRTT